MAGMPASATDWCYYDHDKLVNGKGGKHRSKKEVQRNQGRNRKSTGKARKAMEKIVNSEVNNTRSSKK